MTNETMLLIFGIVASLLACVEIYAAKNRRDHMALLKQYMEQLEAAHRRLDGIPAPLCECPSMGHPEQCDEGAGCRWLKKLARHEPPNVAIERPAERAGRVGGLP